MWTFEEIHNGALDNLGKAKELGVYKVFLPDDFVLKFRTTTDATGDVDNVKSLELLKKRWDLIQSSPVGGGKNIIYIGTTAKQSLGKRVKQFAKYGYGECNNHRGGYPIWQIENNKQLLVEIYPCEDPVGKETELLDAYIDLYGTEPIGNTAVGKGSRYKRLKEEDIYVLKKEKK